ncbi:AsmA-like C-terminal region-containing protein [Lichenicola sp.]|uniref:AsmA-like C-terminal region-containing protein n=1 Tax=Lichenicola sp. TaxID=2804529 RepID=UPI003B002C0F
MTPADKPGQAGAVALAAARVPARAPARALRRRAGGTGSLLRIVLRVLVRPLLAVLVLGVLAIFGFALRLSAGPVDVTWLVHIVTPLSLGGGSDGRGGHTAPLGYLEVGRAQLAWNGLHDGTSLPILIRLEDVSIRRNGGVIVDHLDQARISLLAARLLRGQLAISDIGVAGARLHLARDSENGLNLGLGPPHAREATGNSGPALDWSALSRVQVSDMQLRVHDLVVGQDWSVRDVEIDLRPSGLGSRSDERGIVGQFQAALLMGGHRALLRGHGSTAPAGADPGDVAWHVRLDSVVPSELAAALPVLAPLRSLALPIAPVLDVTFANGPGRFMEPVRANAWLLLGHGEIRAGTDAIRIGSGVVRLDANLPDSLDGGLQLRLQEAELQLRDGHDQDLAATGPEIDAHGSLTLDRLDDARHIGAVLDVSAPRIGFDSLAQYWPSSAAVGARRWITTNITGGEAVGLHVESRLASEHGWGGLAETDRTGGFDADGLTLWWLRPIAPLQDMQARLTFQGPDALLVTSPHAVMPVVMPARKSGGPVITHRIAVSAGSMRITGLEGHDQVATIGAHLSGDLGDLLTELANPRLRLLSQHPLSFSDPSGHSDTDFTLVLPLDDKVKVEQLKVTARSQMTAVHLGNVAAGRALDDGRLSLSATTDGMSLAGTGRIGGIAAKLQYGMDFRTGPPSQVTEEAKADGVVTTAALSREGLDPSGNVEGSGHLAVGYKAQRDGHSTISLGLDLTDLEVSTQVWAKPRGRPAQASAVIGLEHGRLASIERIHATGPGLEVDARAAITGGRARQVVVGHFVLGRSSGVGRVDLPAPASQSGPVAPIRVSARGPVLDLSALVGGTRRTLPNAATPSPPAPKRGHEAAARQSSKRPAPAPPQPWVADLAFGRVYVDHDTALSGVSAYLQDDGRRIEQARIDATGPTAMSVSLAPAKGGRHLHGTAADTGAALRALGVTDALSGGPLRLEAEVGDAMELAGSVEIGRFVVLDAPLAARIVRNLSIYGWLTALPTPQLAVDRLVAPFTLNDQVVTLTDAQAHSAALGVTLHGPIDLKRRSLDLKGTVVPAWAVNQLPGRLPVVGHLFSPEKGGGLLAATLSIKGKLSAPDVHVNALAALAPGILRRLLFE